MKIRWGILGCGSIASHAIAPAIRWSDNGELFAIGSRTRERAEERAAALQAPKAYGSYEALLADPTIDAVYIGLPNGEHVRWAIAAAEAGKHVLCDKSLALTTADAEAVRAAFAARRLVLVEGFMTRHHPQWTLARALVDSGTMGRPRHLRAVLRATLAREGDHRWSKTLGGGALFDVTCYGVNAARLLVGEEPARASGVARWAPSGVDESTDALLDFPSGAVASVHGSLKAPFEQSVVVAMERGRIVMDRPFVPHFEPVEVVVEREGEREVHRVSGANHFLHMVEHVAACIRNPGASRFPAEDGRENVAACAAILEACASGRAVDVRR